MIIYIYLFIAKLPDYEFLKSVQERLDPAPISSNQLLRSALLPRPHPRSWQITNFTVPWHVSISGNCENIVEKFNGSHHCSGVIIGKSHILSAAHCFYGDGEFRQIKGSMQGFLKECSFEVKAGGIDLNGNFQQVKI